MFKYNFTDLQKDQSSDQPGALCSSSRNSDSDPPFLTGLQTRMLVMVVLCTGPFLEKAYPGGWEIMSCGLPT